MLLDESHISQVQLVATVLIVTVTLTAPSLLNTVQVDVEDVVFVTTVFWVEHGSIQHAWSFIVADATVLPQSQLYK